MTRTVLEEIQSRRPGELITQVGPCVFKELVQRVLDLQLNEIVALSNTPVDTLAKKEMVEIKQLICVDRAMTEHPDLVARLVIEDGWEQLRFRRSAIDGAFWIEAVGL